MKTNTDRVRRAALAGAIVAFASGQLRQGPAKAGHYVLSAQQLNAGPPVWNGSVRCDIDINGPGYVTHETHTWTLSGAVPPDGGVLDYPGTWTVTGEGSRKPTETQRAVGAWKTQASAAGVRMAIFVRQSDQKLLVFLRHGQLSAPAGTTGTQLDTALRSQVQKVATTVYEWRPFPAIEDVPTSTHVTGSSTTPIKTRLVASQPLGSMGQAACSWDLVQGAVATGASTAQTAKPIVLKPAGNPGPIIPAPDSTGTAAKRERPPLPPEVQKALADAAAKAEAEAAATSCKPSGTAPSTDPCVTITGPTQVAAGASGTFTLQFSNISTATTTTTYPNGLSTTATPNVQLAFKLNVDGGSQQDVTKSIAAGSSGPITMTWTYTLQNAGAHTVKATGAVIQTISNTNYIPVFDSNGNRIGTTQNQTQVIKTSTMAVQKTVNVTQ
jgi:hypothetical protein